MDYADARAAFFVPREGQIRPAPWRTPARRLRDALEPVAAVSFWSEPVYDALAGHGLDFLQGYVLGRAGVLGKPEASVVAATFGVFEPGLVRDVYDGARGLAPRKEIRAALAGGVDAALTEALGPPPPDASRIAGALRDAASACSVLGRPLFAAWHAAPWPDRPWVQLWHAASTVRELRGDAHLAALGGLGLDGVQANVLTELWVGWEPLAYTATRGWSAEQMAHAVAALQSRGLVSDGALTASGVRLREQIERVTDLAVQPAVRALGTSLEQVCDRLDGWSQVLLDRGWFPPDPYKRAAG